MEDLRITARTSVGDRAHIEPARLSLATNVVEALKELLGVPCWIRIGRLQLTFQGFDNGSTTLRWDIRYHPQGWSHKRFVPVCGMYDIPSGSALRQNPPAAEGIASCIAESIAGALSIEADQASADQGTLESEREAVNGALKLAAVT